MELTLNSANWHSTHPSEALRKAPPPPSAAWSSFQVRDKAFSRLKIKLNKSALWEIESGLKKPEEKAKIHFSCIN
jgi:hypothetical protein